MCANPPRLSECVRVSCSFDFLFSSAQRLSHSRLARAIINTIFRFSHIQLSFIIQFANLFKELRWIEMISRPTTSCFSQRLIQGWLRESQQQRYSRFMPSHAIAANVERVVPYRIPRHATPHTITIYRNIRLSNKSIKNILLPSTQWSHCAVRLLTAARQFYLLKIFQLPMDNWLAGCNNKLKLNLINYHDFLLFLHFIKSIPQKWNS